MKNGCREYFDIFNVLSPIKQIANGEIRMLSFAPDDAGNRWHTAFTPEQLMNNEISLKYYDMADEYATETTKPVNEPERDSLAHYFQLLITRLMNNEEISEEAQQEMAGVAGIDEQRIDEIAEFLNRWGNE